MDRYIGRHCSQTSTSILPVFMLSRLPGLHMRYRYHACPDAPLVSESVCVSSLPGLVFYACFCTVTHYELIRPTPSAGTDIVGYTSLSEKVEPERVMKMLHGAPGSVERHT